ncbi:MAG: type II secretion system F family protein [Candidatus Hydrothermarchaeaceae archaeon]
MAESKLGSIKKRIRIPKKLMPEKFLKQTEMALARGNISFSAQEWAGMFVAIGSVLFLLLTLLISPIYGIVGFVIPVALMIMIPRMQADKRKAQVEDALPDVLHHMSVAIRTGLVMESVIQEISEADYETLSDEFAQVVVEIRRGRPLRDAFLNFSVRTGSKEVRRAINLLLEGMESGGPISDVLEEVSDDLRAVKMIQRERKTSTSQQVSFLGMASLMAGPFVMGVVAALPEIMEQATASLGPENAMPMDDIYKVVDALTFYVVAQAAGCAIMIGVIMYGDFKSGFKYMIPMAMVAYTIFSIIKYIMPGMVSTF